MDIREARRLGEAVWEIPRRDPMRVPARIYALETMLPAVFADKAPDQVVNVAQLPGIVHAALAMPDIHQGYGFPIGGVAAFDPEDGGVVSPGGVGYDINCGVRLMASRLKAAQVRPRLKAVIEALFRGVPAGVGSESARRLSRADLRRAAVDGARWSVEQGFGSGTDLERIEENGRLDGADPDAVSAQAWERAEKQVGTLGAGNHFLEVARVAEIFDAQAAQTFGLFEDQVTVMIHCGSRGFGHQICDDHLAVMQRAAARYGIALPDRQLACAPCGSPEGRAYLGAMRCAVNYAFANRQAIAHRVRGALEAALGMGPEAVGLRTVYEVAHNIAKFETHQVGGGMRRLCVHRKGATRAFAAGRPEIPSAYRGVGQPALVPGDMGRASYVLIGTARAMADTFGSVCHGAGRRMSRHRARREGRGRDIVRELAGRGILVRCRSRAALAEEMPDAYKNISDVVAACECAGLAARVARLEPLACMKG